MDDRLAPAPASCLGMTAHLRLSVTNIPRAERFYDPVMRFFGYRFVARGETRLAWAKLTPGENLEHFILSATRDEFRGARHNRYSPGLHHFCWAADNREQVDALYALLLRQGVTVLDPPAEYDYKEGYYAVFFEDPDGLKLELAHVPTASVLQYWSSAGRDDQSRPGDGT